MPFSGHSEAFKRRALNRVLRGEPVRKVAKQLGITEQTLYRWKKDAEEPVPLAVEQDEDELGEAPEETIAAIEDAHEAADWSGQAFGGMSLDGAVSVTVLREDDRVKGSFAWCEDVPAADFSLATIRSRWGAGRFRFIVRDRLAKPVETRNLIVAQIPSDDTRPQPTSVRPNVGVSALFEQIMHTMLLRALDPPSVWDNVAKAAPIIAPVVGQWFASRAPSADPVQIATAITNAAGAMAGRGSGSDTGGVATEMIRMFRDGIALGQTVTSEREPGFADVAKELGPPLLGILSQKTGAPMALPAPRPQPNGNGAAHRPAPAPQPQPQPQVSPMWAALVPSLDALAPLITDGAQRNEPVSELSERIYAATPAYMQSVIEHAATTPGAIDIVIQRYPALEPYREYVQTLLAELGKPAPAEAGIDE